MTRVEAGSWDYVIVGGGSAGCVLAHRISEDPRTSVLLLEAGGEPKSLAIKVPAFLLKLDKKYDWLYPAEPDGSRHGVAEHWPAGKVLGGGSSINAMCWVRGNRADWDEWAALGCAGWDADGVLPYFRRAERFEGGADAYRGGEGPLRVAMMKVDHPMTDVFIDSAVGAGHRRLEDYNGADQSGVAYAQTNQRRGLRHSSADAFLKPARRRANLTVHTGAVVRRVVLDGHRATGVEFLLGDQVQVAGARREVVLSAGSIGSPKVLLLSGIGPGAHLDSLGIEVRSDLPGVGQNLQEHPTVGVGYKVTGRTLNQDVTPLRGLQHALRFVLWGRGALTSPAAHALVFSTFDGSLGRPDFEIIFVAFGMSAITEETSHDVHAVELSKEPGVSLYPTLLHPEGRGAVSLRSADPADPPRLQHELLGHPADLAGLREACRQTRALFGTATMKQHIVAETLPGEGVESDEDWDGYLREAAFRMNHPVGTCAMGTGNRAVIDPQLRVRGVERLRVVDASIMPTLPSANTNAAAIMIGEKGADLIRGVRV